MSPTPSPITRHSAELALASMALLLSNATSLVRVAGPPTSVDTAR